MNITITAKRSRKYEPEKEPPPPVPMTFNKNILDTEQYFNIPASWKQPRVSNRNFHSLISDKENLKDGLVMQGKAHRRLWSMGWFLPFAGHNRKPSKYQIDKYCKFSS
ncbi:MAG: hypothetical protein IKU91_03270, partial [Anaerotignum sp.]|nr:hypothetical protein [Anaerotignum sp.]